ncbi:Hydantoinase/oxoprolinase [Hysterangium stoloniferum]|nr:Hydantoinase/oxoprolinase [Hysterangium stoloniferum]
MSTPSSQESYRIGVDVGGTNTDSVLFCTDPTAVSRPDRGILTSFKHPTTPIVSDGIEAAIRAILHRANVSPAQITGVMIGSELLSFPCLSDAVVEADANRLSKVAVIRLGAPYTEECPPFLDFPSSLKSITKGHVAILSGGLEIDGKLINEINEEELINESLKIHEKGLKAVAIVGVFSPLDRNDGTSQEERAKAIMSKILGPSVHIVCSRDVGQIGLLERENASILNASILAFARRTISGFQRAIHRLGLSCPIYLTQNDGTLTTAEAAARLPIRTFSSGATNSMRGAAFLAGLGLKDGNIVSKTNQSIIVADIGGTTTDVGVLLPSGFPRQAAAFIKVGGVRTNFSMPDVYSIGLGGGTRVHVTAGKDAHSPIVKVGPDSTGYQLLTEGIVFGGSTLTTTDIVVAENPSLSIGDSTKVINGTLGAPVLKGAKAAIRKLLEEAIDRMKTTPEPATVLLVGGGSIIAPEELKGVGNLIRPQFFSCANAVGACIANVAGEIDTIEILQDKTLSDVLEKCKSEAIARAIKNGAKPHTVKVVEIENLPVQYVTNKATRIIVKAVGELDYSAVIQSSLRQVDDGTMEDYCDESVTCDKMSAVIDVLTEVDAETYVPYVDQKREWILSEVDLEWIAEGCGILGTGGGGSPYPPFIMQIVRDEGTIRVIAHDALPDDALILRGEFMGSPSVSNERIQAGTEIETACKNLLKFIEADAPQAIISDEIGGGNGLQPMILGSTKHFNVPVFDGDLMGRAYPNMWQTLPVVYGTRLTPCALADGVGNTVILPSTSNMYMVETILRTICTNLGSKAGVSMAPLSAATCRKLGVTKSVSQAWRIGRAVAQERQKNNYKGIPEAILKLQNGKTLFSGKIVEVQREWGWVTIMALLNDEEEHASDPVMNAYNENDRLRISFQNENLTAELISGNSQAAVNLLAVVPDLITVLDSQSGMSLGTHEYRYGLRVTVLALAGSPLWTTPTGLKDGGPGAFGLDVAYHSVGPYKEPVSVIEEFYKGS